MDCYDSGNVGLNPALPHTFVEIILAHQIRISDILSWDRKSYLTHVILPRLSREGCTLVVLERRHT